MASRGLDRLLDQLDEAKRPSGASHLQSLRGLLARLRRTRFRDPSQLIRFHEILLFMRAYPQSPALLRQTESLLASFGERVRALSEEGADMTPFTEPEVSGISETAFSTTYSYDMLRHLAREHPSHVEIDWDGYDEEERFALVMARFLPLLEEDSYVETYYPLLDFLRAAKGRRGTDLSWMLGCFERLDLPEKAKAELFDSMKLWLRWELGGSSAARTRMKLSRYKPFYHTGALLRRANVSLAEELEAPPLHVEKLTRTEGERLLRAGRATMALRYRELHGYTYGDAATVRRAEAGRGVELFVWGVPHERRLPTLAYHAALILKNGVPHGYAEALSLFERAEVGLNLFYTFRDGESAWIYARLLRLFRQLLGIEVFSIDPYQLGHENEEGLASGAFWFYRKLGFRPIQPALMKITEAEERRITRRAGYRSSARILQELVSGHVIFEARGAAKGEWDSFHVRNLGLAVQRRLASQAGGDARRLREKSDATVSSAFGISTRRWNEREREAFSNLALLLSLVPNLTGWSSNEKRALIEIVRAKAGLDEARYLRLLQAHARLRREIIRLGSAGHG